MKIGLIGAGRIGRIHAHNLVTTMRSCELARIADVHLPSAESLAEELNLYIPVSDDFHTVLNDKTIDAVLICSSTDTHADAIMAAARAGKHIFCEKPIDHDLARIDEVLNVVQESGVTLQIGFNRRFDPNYARVRQAVVNGEIGRPELIHIISRDPSPPPIDYVKVSGGMFFDMTIHDFDMARFLIGTEVVEVFTMGDVMVDPAIGEAGDIDTAVIMLRFENGVLGTIDNSRRAVYGYDQRVEVFGSDGAIQTANNYPNQATLHTAVAIRHDLPLNFFLERYAESYRLELMSFVDSVRMGSIPPITGEDGRTPVVMAMAALQSLKENRPVRLDEIHA